MFMKRNARLLTGASGEFLEFSERFAAGFADGHARKTRRTFPTESDKEHTFRDRSIVGTFHKEGSLRVGVKNTVR